MARKLRLEFPGAIYHVINRGNYRLDEYRYSSYWYLRRKRRRPSFLQCETALVLAGGLVDSSPGWRAYADYLAWQAIEGPAGKNQAYVSLSSGWALGSRDFKAALVKDHGLLAISRAWEDGGAREIREMQCAGALAKALQTVAKTDEDCRRERKSAPWKIAVAAHLKRTTQASNRWLAERLRMGSPVAVCQYVRAFRGGNDAAYRALNQMT